MQSISWRFIFLLRQLWRDCIASAALDFCARPCHIDAMNPEDPFFAAGARVQVLTAEPIAHALDYLAPEGGVVTGAWVLVPLGPRRVAGVVWGAGQGDFPRDRLRPIAACLDLPPMPPEMRAFLDKAAAYVLAPPSAMMRLASRMPGLTQSPAQQRLIGPGGPPPARMTEARRKLLATVAETGPMRAQALARAAGVGVGVVSGLVKAGALIEIDAPRDAPYPRLDPDHPAPHQLSDAQKTAATALCARIGKGYSTCLLRGVTGSGKTEVYLEAVARTLRLGRQVLVLLPEIALTSDFIARVKARFGARPVTWHSARSPAERRRAWRAVADGSAQMVVGARSALFLPFADLGLIVVDEEHDGSYKQEEQLLYNARDMAVLRASLTGAQVVLASATPSLESWANAEAGKYTRLDLTERFGTARLPQMAAIDMRGEDLPNDRWISPSLQNALSETLSAGDQALLFLNRRGFAPLTLCRACGQQIGCKDCDARMVEHRRLNRLICHQCGAEAPIPRTCPACGAEDRLAALGPGIERIAAESALLFPTARIVQLSSDLAAGGALRKRIAEIARGEADIIIGTQLVAKGHNFPQLTLVGVIDADLGLEGGDPRAAEKSFQLIRQVAGRAGRADRPGRALLQSYQPDHPVIRAILDPDDEAFWQAEANRRRAAGAPPYGRLAAVILSGPDEAETFAAGQTLLRSTQNLRAQGADIFGPAPAPIARIRGNYRVRLLVKSPRGVALQPHLAAWRAQTELPKKVRMVIDIDPMSFL